MGGCGGSRWVSVVLVGVGNGVWGGFTSAGVPPPCR